MTNCLYECKSRFPSTQKYHVLPFSASALELTLPPGIVCDGCNAFFSKLEKYFVERHPGSSRRLLGVKETRKGKPPVFESQAGVATRKDGPRAATLDIPLNELKYDQLPNGDFLLTGLFKPKPFDSVKIGRLLTKIAVEYLVRFRGEGELDPFEEQFKPLREYARFGPRGLKFLWFAWKRTQEPQQLPRVVRIQEKGEPAVALLCRISLPGVAYLVPLLPLVAPGAICANLAGWRVVEKAGEVQLEPERIQLILGRVPASGPPDSGSAAK